MRDYLELTKPNVTWLILMSTAVGFYLGSPAPSLGGLNWILLVHAVIGTALVASGTGALNQWMERVVDGKMRRTQARPLPAGRLCPVRAFWFGLALAVAGTAYLAVMVNGLTGFLGAFTCTSYLLCYTPLKSRTPHATLVGAFPGAMPILMGWTAASGRLTIEGWVLYAILFLWQFPHFLAIAALYREDYERGGIRMLPVVEPAGRSTRRQILGYTVALLAVSVVPTLLGLNGKIYLTGTLLLGFAFLYFGLDIASRYTKLQARRLLQASVIYLPLVYVLMVVDKA
jgi:protoheme IX farnesyltransferase